jgi:hypothetical protein
VILRRLASFLAGMAIPVRMWGITPQKQGQLTGNRTISTKSSHISIEM